MLLSVPVLIDISFAKRNLLAESLTNGKNAISVHCVFVILANKSCIQYSIIDNRMSDTRIDERCILVPRIR